MFIYQVSELQANIGQYKTDMVERLTVLDDLASSFSSDIGATLTQQKEDMQMTKEAHEVLNKVRLKDMPLPYHCSYSHSVHKRFSFPAQFYKF